MPDIIVKQQPTTSLTVQSNSTQLIIRQAAANNVTISTGSSSYVLPMATNSTLGGIIVGSNLTINNGVLSATSSGSGGVESFNNRTGNVTLTANDVTAAANGSFLLNQYSTANTSYGVDTFYGLIKNPGIVNSQDPTQVYPFYAGKIGVVGERGIVGLNSSTDPCNIEFHPGDAFGFMRFRSYNQSFIFSPSDGLIIETGTSSWNWTANTVLTQGRGDARYQPVGSYLTSANLTWSNLTGKPTFATVATSGSYTDLANTPNLSLYYLASNPSGYITASCLTYSNITGTPNLSLYLTTANAATTYLPSANFTYANIGGTIPTATNTTLGAIKVGSNLTIANGVLSANAYTLPNATTTTLGGIIVGSGLAIANGVLSSTTVNIDGGSATTTGTGSYDGGSATTN